MRAKLTILFTAVLVLALGASQAQAQAGGYDVLRAIETVVQHGKNQTVGQIELHYDNTGGIIDAGSDLTFTFGGLPIAVNGTATCANGVTCAATDLTLSEDKTMLMLNTTGTPTGNALTIDLEGVRVDVSSLEAGDEVMVTISTSAPSGLIPVGQSRRGTVTTSVGVVKAGLTVAVTAASRLICNLDAMETTGPGTDGQLGTDDDVMSPVGGVPMITVTEGFDDAWEGDAALGGTTIRIKTLNLPAGVELRWPQTVTFGTDDEAEISTLTLAGDNAANVVVDEAVEDNTDQGDDITYNYAIVAAGTGANQAGGEMDVFEIPITVVTGDIATGAGGIADIWGILAPAPGDDDGGTVLSYVMTPVTDPMLDMGRFLNIAECVTYLLFPYVTCSKVDEDGMATDDWTTAIAIANTTMDDGVFGLSGGATAQNGAITLHTFPKSYMGEDGMMMMADPGMMMVAENVAAGDTWAGTCHSTMPGFTGYVIAKAGFRQAHGVAFVLGMFPGGASIDVAHGYLGLVIPDPEFGGDRAAAAGETLGN